MQCGPVLIQEMNLNWLGLDTRNFFAPKTSTFLMKIQMQKRRPLSWYVVLATGIHEVGYYLIFLAVSHSVSVV